MRWKSPAFRWDGRKTTEYKEWRRAVLDRHGSKCVMCGSYKQVICHHLKNWEDYPDLRHDPDNGIVLCWECHEREHDYRKDCLIDLVYVYDSSG